MLTEKDETTLVKLPNTFLADYHARVMITDAPESILAFYEQHSAKITGDVVVVRSKADEAAAAHARNTSSKVLFVFGKDYWLTSYFSGVCQRITLPVALLKRSAR